MMPNPSTIAESEDITEKWNELDRKLYYQQRAEIAALKAENALLLTVIKTKNELIERLTLQLLGVK